jgi:hypothetical protein
LCTYIHATANEIRWTLFLNFVMFFFLEIMYTVHGCMHATYMHSLQNTPKTGLDKRSIKGEFGSQVQKLNFLIFDFEVLKSATSIKTIRES